MKERVGDEKLIIISVAVRDITDHIRFYSQMLCNALYRYTATYLKSYYACLSSGVFPVKQAIALTQFSFLYEVLQRTRVLETHSVTSATYNSHVGLS